MFRGTARLCGDRHVLSQQQARTLRTPRTLWKSCRLQHLRLARTPGRHRRRERPSASAPRLRLVPRERCCCCGRTRQRPRQTAPHPLACGRCKAARSDMNTKCRYRLHPDSQHGLLPSCPPCREASTNPQTPTPHYLYPLRRAHPRPHGPRCSQQPPALLQPRPPPRARGGVLLEALSSCATPAQLMPRILPPVSIM